MPETEVARPPKGTAPSPDQSGSSTVTKPVAPSSPQAASGGSKGSASKARTAKPAASKRRPAKKAPPKRRVPAKRTAAKRKRTRARPSKATRKTTSFKKGDKVVHPHHGAAVITNKVEKEIQGNRRSYFELEIATGQLTVFVPWTQSIRTYVR